MERATACDKSEIAGQRGNILTRHNLKPGVFDLLADGIVPCSGHRIFRQVNSGHSLEIPAHRQCDLPRPTTNV